MSERAIRELMENGVRIVKKERGRCRMKMKLTVDHRSTLSNFVSKLYLN